MSCKGCKEISLTREESLRQKTVDRKIKGHGAKTNNYGDFFRPCRDCDRSSKKHQSNGSHKENPNQRTENQKLR